MIIGCLLMAFVIYAQHAFCGYIGKFCLYLSKALKMLVFQGD